MVKPDKWPPLLSARSAISSASLVASAKRLGLAGGAAFLGDLVELGLRLLDLLERGDLLAGVERAFDEFAADADQGPEQREVINLRREVACADDRRARSRQLG